MPLLPLIPLRPTFLVIGLLPFAITHPISQRILPTILKAGRGIYLEQFQRITDNDRLDDATWGAPKKEVELWENERWASSTGGNGGTGTAGWSKGNLKPGERKAWTRRRDGWSEVQAKPGWTDTDVRSVEDYQSIDISPIRSVSSNLTFTLESGWAFIDSEDWRPDILGSWVEAGADDGELSSLLSVQTIH